ncbi:MAG: hypothetical protein JNK23_10905 [Opitutaceae bacterium]|nr:hypothetical protein [Opitutaceae bacterium]
MTMLPALRPFMALTAAVSIAAPGFAQTTTLRLFNAETSTADLVQTPDGTIYGAKRPITTSIFVSGQVFKLQPDGTGYQDVHRFSSALTAQLIPITSAPVPDYALILGRDGVLYGTGRLGGNDNHGMVYKVNPDGSGYALLRSFNRSTSTNNIRDAGEPQGGLVHASDGFLYGAAGSGTMAGTISAATDLNGVIYRLATDGSGYTLLYAFDRGVSPASGRIPTTLIQGRDGRLYGTTRAGGANSSQSGELGGTVFTLRTDGTGFTVLHSFGPNLAGPAASVRGITPMSPLVHAADGFLYGTTISSSTNTGATSRGCIYRLLPDGSGFEIIHAFDTTAAARGLAPAGALFQGRDGSLYGRTDLGGSLNFGVIYKIRTDGSGFRVLHNFTTSRSTYFGALFQGLDGALYATTETTIIRVVETPGFEITQQPRSQTIAPGGSATFTVTAPGATTYQWRRNGANIAGATATTYTLNNLTTAANATYSVVVGNGNAADSVTSTGAVLLVATPNPGRLINLSVRTSAGTGAETLIVGFVVGGTGNKQVLVRAIGPALAGFGVPGVLAEPRLSLHSGPAEMAVNAGWGGTPALASAFGAVGAFALNATSRDAALLSNLGAGAYSAQVTSATGATGVALVEAYDADTAGSGTRFINLSARTVAGTGAQTLIAGFVLSGNVPRTLLIRGIGPTLGTFGVAGALAHPRLELRNAANAVVATNAGWGGAPALAAAFVPVGAFALPATSGDAALLVSLAPGAYTAQVAGVGGGTGVALVEVYEVP